MRVDLLRYGLLLLLLCVSAARGDGGLGLGPGPHRSASGSASGSKNGTSKNGTDPTGAAVSASASASANASQTCILGTVSGCSTGTAAGITNQIIAELRSMGHTFTQLPTQWVRCSSPCISQLASAAADALVAAARARNDFITLNSAFRSSADQYLLYTWYLRKQCGIGLAAKPGQSNHESGQGIDTSYYTYWRPTLEQHGWKWYGSGDPVHFDYTRGQDLRSTNLRAFQRLWNRHRSQKLQEDGVYGPATENALYNTPCNGF